MVDQARKMYHELSPETGEFIDFMIDHELMDLKNKPGKASTGYMTSLDRYKAPFVFSCFNQTIFDMQVLTRYAPAHGKQLLPPCRNRYVPAAYIQPG